MNNINQRHHFLSENISHRDYSTSNDNSKERNVWRSWCGSGLNKTVNLRLSVLFGIIIFAVGVILVNEIIFPEFNLLPIKKNLFRFNSINRILYSDGHVNEEEWNRRRPEKILFTSVGFKGCTDFVINYDMLNSLENINKLQIKNYKNDDEHEKVHVQVEVKSVEIPSKEEFQVWLSRRQDVNQVPLYHLSSPVNFVNIGNVRKFIGGLDELREYIKSHSEWLGLNEQLLGVVLQLEDVDKDDHYKQVFESNYVDPGTDIEVSEDMDGTQEEISSEITGKDNKGSIYRHHNKIVPMLTPQVDFSKRKQLLVSAFRKNPEKTVTNHKPIWQHLTSDLHWKFKWRAPALAAFVIVQDQASAAQAHKYRNNIVNNIGMGGQSCYGGTKGTQMRCRMELAARDGCEYDQLRVQPPQYRFWIEEECSNFFDSICADSNNSSNIVDERLWIEKPSAGQHGAGMKVHRGCNELRKKWGKCDLNKFKKKWFVMEYIDPALLDGHKFDVRTYLLVASLDPLLVFYHDGFVRRAGLPYNSDITDSKAHITNAHSQDNVEDHFWDFGRLEKFLHEQDGFPEDYIRNHFRKHAIKVENFVFQAARRNMFRRKGTYQLFALDWIIDSKGGIHMLEANSNPLVDDYPIPGFPETFNTLVDLVLAVQDQPELLQRENGPLITLPDDKRFTFHGWDLIFNELEEAALGLEFNACNYLQGLNSKPFAAHSASQAYSLAIERLEILLNQEAERLASLEPETDDVIADNDSEDDSMEENDMPDLSEDYLKQNPKDILRDIIKNNQPRGITYDDPFLRAKYKCEDIVSESGGPTLRCIIGQGKKYQTYFYASPAMNKAISPESTPTVFVVSGVHGNEPAGVVAARHLRRKMRLFNANLIVIPRVNAPGIISSQRYMDATKQDLNRIFPDSTDDQPDDDLAKAIWEVVELAKPDIFFDFHEGWGLYTLLKDNPHPTNKLIGNSKFSKGSSVIATFNTQPLVTRMTQQMNNPLITGDLLSILRSEVQKSQGDENRIFLGSYPPIEGGLAQRVNTFFGAMCFVQETTSRQGNQPLETRALQHLFLFALAMKELDLGLMTSAHSSEDGISWILNETLEKCVAGRKNCVHKYPGDRFKLEESVGSESDVADKEPGNEVDRESLISALLSGVETDS